MTQAKSRLLHSIIATLLAITVFLLPLLIRQQFDLTGWCDAFFISGAVNLGVTGLLFIGEKGVYDMMGYGMYRLIGLFKKQEELKYRNAYDYKESMLEKRAKNPFFFLPYLIASGVMLLISVILLFFR